MNGARGPLTVLVLAAGQGKRLKSKTIKLLHPVAGRPMVHHVVRAARAIRPGRLVAVVGYQGDRVSAAIAPLSDAVVVQAEQRGTGDAVLRASSEITRRGTRTVLIVNGDLPMLRSATLRELAARHRRYGAALTVVTTEVDDPTGYGRVVRDAAGRVERIVEHRDATASERRIREINCGIYCADPAKLVRVLRKLRPDNAQGEYYLTDAVHRLLTSGEKVAAYRHPDAREVLGVNTRAELAEAGRALYARRAEELMSSGVTLLDPARTLIEPEAVVGRDSVIYPGVIIEGASRLGEDCVVYSGCRLTNVRAGRGVEFRDYSVVTDSVIEDGASVGPFAHVRPGSVIGEEARVGNFVELKKARLGRGTKASHLSYLGDADIGPECNIGAGTITCNYDGTNKNQTTLEQGVFIGSDTQLVAPVHVGRGAYVGAGTTVTEDVPAGALALTRTRQVNVEGWVERRKARARSVEGDKPSRVGRR